MLYMKGCSRIALIILNIEFAHLNMTSKIKIGGKRLLDVKIS